MTTIEVMKQALEQLQRLACDYASHGATTALRAEIERLEAVEPVAWAETEKGEIAWDKDSCFSDDPAWFDNPVPLYTHPAPAVPESVEPVAFTNKEQLGYLTDPLYAVTPMAMWATKFAGSVDIPLYTSPAPSYDVEKWQLVPKEPTDSMVWQAVNAMADNELKVLPMWRSMLSAAPNPEDV